MKKSELKKILKPLIRECVKEVILDEGVLSGVISEVAIGFSGTAAAPPPVIVEEADPTQERMRRNAFTTQQKSALHEQRKKLMEAVGSQAYNGVDLFEGTSPAPAQTSGMQQGSPLAGIDPGDAGVDISNLFGSVAKNWGAHMDNVKEGKK